MNNLNLDTLFACRGMSAAYPVLHFVSTRYWYSSGGACALHSQVAQDVYDVGVVILLEGATGVFSDLVCWCVVTVASWR